MTFSTIASLLALAVALSFVVGLLIGKLVLTVPPLTAKTGFVLGTFLFIAIFVTKVLEAMTAAPNVMMTELLVEACTSTFLVGTIVGYCWQLNGLKNKTKRFQNEKHS